jgi:hypothetical protein
MAVAVGFEPTRVLPLHDFELRTDVHPRVSRCIHWVFRCAADENHCGERSWMRLELRLLDDPSAELDGAVTNEATTSAPREV